MSFPSIEVLMTITVSDFTLNGKSFLKLVMSQISRLFSSKFLRYWPICVWFSLKALKMV